ncbi:helix-turn-helix domain-containing protein [Streptomyces uncialis]|uniref:helix-turn-helix domain-containing protein n=1 Tax=Streptomyces uncialis TaxID=1048205 RepID=UPI00386C6B2E|nr:helix-turn-helix domain-containing protein [Streptomyces uncialis]
MDRLPIGARIRHFRERAQRTQTAVAGLCGISDRYLSLIENGRKTPSPEVLGRLAVELGVPMAALLSDHPVPVAAVVPMAAPAVERALICNGSPLPASPVAPADLRERVEAAWRMWQTSRTRFTEAEAVLPALITETEHAVRSHRRGTDPVARREVMRTAADLYGLLRSYCRRVGRLDLSLMVADRALRAAEDADDPLRIAAARWNLGHALLSRPDGASAAADVVLNAAEELARTLDTPEAAAVGGALELVAVVADASARRPWPARERLERRARPLAAKSGELNARWTVFGPTNVDLHALSIEMLAGQASDALHLADRVDVSGLPSRERRFTFALEVARCYDLRRDDAATLVHLLGLEELAPEDLARSPLAREMVTALMTRVRPTYRQQATGLAARLGLL